MRPILASVLAALLVPGCLSGFAEIRVAGPDAGSADRPAVADAAARDAPEDRPEVVDGIDVGRPEVDAADVLEPGDATDTGAPEDRGALAQDAGAVVDAPAPEDRAEPLDAGDAGAIVDAPSAPDVVDAGECAGGCAAGDVCEGGRCGRWRFVLAISVEATAQQRYAASPTGIDAAGSEVCEFIARGRPVRACRRVELGPAEMATACRDRAAVGDIDLVREVGTRHMPGCVVCPADAGAPAAVDGERCGGWPPTIACCAFE